MSEAEKKVVSSDPSLELEPVNMYVLFARMFADIAREVEADFGEAGIQAGAGVCSALVSAAAGTLPTAPR